MTLSRLHVPKKVNPHVDAFETARNARIEALDARLPEILLSIHAKKFDDHCFQFMLDHFGQCGADHGTSFMEAVDEYWRHCEWLRNSENLAWQKQEKDAQTIRETRATNPAFDAVLTAAEASGKLPPGVSDNAEGRVDNSGNLAEDRTPPFVIDSPGQPSVTDATV